jgi:putative G/U mismatch-specific DNA glycosylase
VLKGFAPIIAKQPRVMILGSMPSVTSLEKQEYYGFAHNRFWKILHAQFGMPIATYEQKKAIILTHHMILWDVIGECEREGSLDSAIRNEKVNPIDELLEAYPEISIIICNGRKSYELFQKHFAHLDKQVIYLPSTSNANRTIKEEALFAKWMQVLSAYDL